MQDQLDKNLLVSAKSGNLAQVKDLLAKGANPLAKDNQTNDTGKSLNDMM